MGNMFCVGLIRLVVDQLVAGMIGRKRPTDRRPIGRKNILLNQRVRLVADHLVAFFFLDFPWGTIGRGP
jgi:hypothetical protein